MPTKKHTLSNDSDDEVATKKVKKASTAVPPHHPMFPLINPCFPSLLPLPPLSFCRPS